MESRVRIRIGEIEVECEGAEAFVKGELIGIVERIRDVFAPQAAATLSAVGATKHSADGSKLEMTTNTIATKLHAETGSDLAFAAAARLALGDGKPTFSRKELLDEMQAATSYYEKNYSGNLTRILATLVKDDKLKETASNIYSLTVAAQASLVKTLADA